MSHASRQRTLRQKKLAFVRRAKERPCTDCGRNHPYYVMDFDHVRGEKLFNLSMSCYKVGFEALMTEIRKCDLVCANCHRIREHERKLLLTRVM